MYSGFGAYGLSGDIGSDGIDNDNDGKIDNLGEVWSTSNSGIIFSLNYRF